MESLSKQRKDTKAQTENLDPRTIRLVKKAAKRIDCWEELAAELASKAAKYLSFEKAVTLLKKEDFFQIVMKEAFLDSLFDATEIPLYTPDELKIIIELFIIFLEQNRQEIIDFGYTSKRFDQCPWLDLELSNLYPAACTLDYISRWNDEVDDLSADLLSSKIRLISVADEKKINNERASLISAKICVLQVLLSAFTGKTTSNVMELCLRTLEKRFFTDDQLAYYFNVDQKYAVKPVVVKYLSFPLVKPNPGGLHAILNLIIHCLQELEFGLKRRIRNHLKNIVKMNQSGCLKVNISSYFQLINRPEEKLSFDNAFFTWSSQSDAEELIFELYRGKIRQFFTEVKLKPERLEAVFFEDLGTSKSNVFCKRGNNWAIVFGKDRAFVPHTKGMYYIKQLLQSPGDEIHVLTLEDYAHLTKVLPTQKEHDQIRWENSKHDKDSSKDVKKSGELPHIGFPTGLYIDDKDRGNRRDHHDEREASRKRVFKYINKAKNNIEKAVPKLWYHLENSIKYNAYEYSYSPDRPLRWTTRVNT